MQVSGTGGNQGAATIKGVADGVLEKILSERH